MAHLKVKRNIGKIWPSSYPYRKIILLYHSIGLSPWAMPLSQFRDQINWLSDHCRITSLTELICSPLDNTIQVAITFDDGYQSIYELAAAYFLEKKINATVYLNTGWMGISKNDRKQSNAQLGHYPSEFFLIWPEVRELYESGWEIGSHGVNHYNFTQTSNDLLYKELIDSKQSIENHIDEECLHFSYPWGKHSRHVEETLKSTGYKYAVAAYHASLRSFSNLYTLPRINIANEYSLEDFKNIVKGKWDFLGLIHKIKGL